MRFGFAGTAAADWPELLELCAAAEAAGFDGLWYADHFMPNTEDPVGPVNESFTMLAAVAATVPRVRIGHMVVGLKREAFSGSAADVRRRSPS